MLKAAKRVIIKTINQFGYDLIKKSRTHQKENIISSVQGIIEKLCLDPQYAHSYIRHESGAWGPIPMLLFQRANERDSSGKRMLDIGCGFGTLLGIGKVLGWLPVGIDFVPLEQHMGEKVRNWFNIEFHRLNIEIEPPRLEGRFDVITMTEVLEHMHFQPLDVMKKVKGLLAEDGCLLISTPALGKFWQPGHHSCPFEEIPTWNGVHDLTEYEDVHMKIYNMEELSRLLDKSGFKRYVGLHVNPETGLEQLHAIAFHKERF